MEELESDDSKAVASGACLYSPAGLQLTRCGSRRRRGEGGSTGMHAGGWLCLC